MWQVWEEINSQGKCGHVVLGAQGFQEKRQKLPPGAAKYKYKAAWWRCHRHTPGEPPLRRAPSQACACPLAMPVTFFLYQGSPQSSVTPADPSPFYKRLTLTITVLPPPQERHRRIFLWKEKKNSLKVADEFLLTEDSFKSRTVIFCDLLSRKYIHVDKIKHAVTDYSNSALLFSENTYLKTNTVAGEDPILSKE